jgi:hypothetical protein
LLQDANEVTTDEATGAGDDDEIILGHLAGAFRTKRGLLSDFSKTCEVGPKAPPAAGQRSGGGRAGLFVCLSGASPSSHPVTRGGCEKP